MEYKVKDKTLIIDEEFKDVLDKLKINIRLSGDGYYHAYTNEFPLGVKVNTVVPLHRLMFGDQRPLRANYKNGNTLDLRRENISFVNQYDYVRDVLWARSERLDPLKPPDMMFKLAVLGAEEMTGRMPSKKDVRDLFGDKAIDQAIRNYVGRGEWGSLIAEAAYFAEKEGE